jgi:hypothetical protein
MSIKIENNYIYPYIRQNIGFTKKGWSYGRFYISDDSDQDSGSRPNMYIPLNHFSSYA